MFPKHEIQGPRWYCPRLSSCFIVASMFGLVLLSWCSGAEASAVCGDANGDGNVDVGDPVYLINYVFKSGPPPEPMYTVDVNRDGYVNIGDVVYMIACIFRAGPPPTCVPYAYLTGHGECKSSVRVLGTDSIPSDQDCIEYQYSETGMLMLQHINAGFNCCVDDITADITIRGDTIFIKEAEVNPNCHCLCLYDLEMVMTNVPPGQYIIKVVEPYVREDDSPLEFPVDLAVAPSGTFCVGRDHYPWHPPTPSVTGYGDCKQHGKAFSPDSLLFDDDCLQFQYDGAGWLLLKHVNAAFNCCPDSILADIKYPDDPGDVIVITEKEIAGTPCPCLCVFDVDYAIPIFIPGTYTIRVIGMYLDADDEMLEITVDLTEPISGERCIVRTQYPWDL